MKKKNYYKNRITYLFTYTYIHRTSKTPRTLPCTGILQCHCIKHCLKNLFTTHEDVELGRCVQKYAGVSCTWSYEVIIFFLIIHIDHNDRIDIR